MMPLGELIQSVSSAFMPGLIIVALLMPFWYLCIYLFGRKFYNSNSEVLKWVTAFCLAFCWYVAFVLFIAMPPVYEHTETWNDLPTISLVKGKIASFYFKTGGYALLALMMVIPVAYLRYRKKPTKGFTDTLMHMYLALAAVWIVTKIFSVITGRGLF